MRIAMFFSSDPTLAGGIQEHIYYLSNAIRQQGHELTLFGPRADNSPYQHYVSLGQITQVKLPESRWISLHTVKGEELEEVFHESEFDICHIHQPYAANVAWQIVRTTSLPKVVTFHDAWGDDSRLNLLNPVISLLKFFTADQAQGVIYISPLVRKRWQKLFDERTAQKHIGYGIDHTKFAPKKHQDHRPLRLLFMARLVRRKGLPLLLNALALVKRQGVRFHLDVVGDGPQRAEVEAQLQALDLHQEVTLYGEIKGLEKISFYQKADVFCAPYSDEGLGLTILEAMGCGCPVVGFWNDAYGESLHKYPGMALMVKSGDVSGLAQALSTVIRQKKLRSKLRKWLITKSHQYDWTEVARETIEMYEEVSGLKMIPKKQSFHKLRG